jgi:hypothetical protein
MIDPPSNLSGFPMVSVQKTSVRHVQSPITNDCRRGEVLFIRHGVPPSHVLEGAILNVNNRAKSFVPIEPFPGRAWSELLVRTRMKNVRSESETGNKRKRQRARGGRHCVIRLAKDGNPQSRLATTTHKQNKTRGTGSGVDGVRPKLSHEKWNSLLWHAGERWVEHVTVCTRVTWSIIAAG